MSKVWRDHSKCPPDEFELCLVIDYNDDYALAWYNDGYWFEQDTEATINVKYWAKLPVAPYD